MHGATISQMYRHGRLGGLATVLRPEDPISAFVEIRDAVAVLRVSGELDVGSAAALKCAISEAWGPGTPALVIDLSDVGFLGSVGISVLLQARERIGGDRFAVVTGGPKTGRTFQILDLVELLPVHVTLEEALRSVRSS